MIKLLYRAVTSYPKVVILVLLSVTVLQVMQFGKIRWETDARVYMPKGHPAILYDEKVDEIFGVKDAVIIGIVNEKGIFNKDSLALIDRITTEVASLPGVKANRTLDIASLSTASVFSGDDESMGAVRLMESPPETQQAIDQLKALIFKNEDLFIGNIVSEDGKAAMIRAKLKEGAANRYMTYWAIKAILSKEQGSDGAGGNQWWSEGAGGEENQWWDGKDEAGQGKSSQSSSQQDSNSDQDESYVTAEENGDVFYLAGRPVIEVISGLDALDDLKMMIPLIIIAMVIVLGVIFSTARGVILPLSVTLGAIAWTMGTMAALDIPMYTISTMLPVILVAIGIGDSVHIMSNYYDNVLTDPHREGRVIMSEVLSRLGPPLITTSITTAIGFLSLVFAEMPPFKIFGLLTVLGIFYSWLLSVTLIPSALSLMQPKVGRYLSKKRSLRVRSEQSIMTRFLVAIGEGVNKYRLSALFALSVLLIASVILTSRLYVDSSWLSDFRKDSEVALSNALLNEKFDGTLFLSVVVEGDQPGVLKSPIVLNKIEALQEYLEKNSYVGDSISIVDYLKSMNKTLHSDREDKKVLPETEEQIGEYLFLYSVSGQPELLDEVIDYNYRTANVSFLVKTDHTRHLGVIIEDAKAFIAREFDGLPVTVNIAGSANNSYVWADLLIDSQAAAIVFSKIGILVIAALIFRSLSLGLITIIPVSIATLFIAALAGLFRIPLDVSTALAAGVAIGVGVDYAVHYLYRYDSEISSGSSHLEATISAMRGVGRTITFNAIVVTVGFSVLFFSKFPPHAKLGYFVASYMAMSCLVALTVLPLVLSFKQPRRR